MNISVERKDGVGRVTLNRPEVRNAFDDALIAALAKAFGELDADPQVRVVVLAGNGPAFCAGADLNWMKRMAGYSHDENLRDARALADMLATLDRLDKPTIARVHGPAFAGGTGLVAACDIAVGAPEAKFCFSEAKLGLSPATISPYVLRAIGPRAASRYFLTAEVFDAAEALRIGLLSAVVPAAELDAFVGELLVHLLAGGAAAHARIKHLVRDVAGRPIDAALQADTARRIAEIRASPEGKEGVASFLEKRKPKWFSGKS
jgi:methylglutaconyl-CoA hydratase